MTYNTADTGLDSDSPNTRCQQTLLWEVCQSLNFDFTSDTVCCDDGTDLQVWLLRNLL